jgi:hypothetical protein
MRDIFVLRDDYNLVFQRVAPDRRIVTFAKPDVHDMFGYVLNNLAKAGGN